MSFVLPAASSPRSSPQKRRRSQSPSERDGIKRRVLELFPRSAVLLKLPSLLSVPPNHRASVTSYAISLAALRKCIDLRNLSPDEECRAWAGLAEIGMRLAKAGWTRDDRLAWAKGVDMDVETAIGKGLLISQQNPSLALYKQALILIQAQRAQWLQNEKFSRSLLKRLVTEFTIPRPFETARTPSWFIYAAHLTNISHALSSTPVDLKDAFLGLQTLLAAAETHNDPPIRILAHVLRLQIHVDAAMWDNVQASLAIAESALGLTYDDEAEEEKREKGKDGGKKRADKNDFIMFEDAFEVVMVVHSLILGVVYYTHVGLAHKPAPRLTHLHNLLDSQVLDKFPNGTIEIKLSSGLPLVIKCTHPRVLYHLAFLVSSASKRDAAGKKPKRKVFAVEGLSIMEKEIKKEVTLNPWAEPRDAEEVDEREVKMKTDVMSELVAVCIMRSEFEEASATLDRLITHTRAFNIFTAYSAKITLHHAHLAHALGDINRAAQCYDVAAYLAVKGSFVNISARAGSLALRIAHGESCVDEVGVLEEDSKGMGSNLKAVCHVLRACTMKEIVKAKYHLKEALELLKHAQDNHLRALILALLSTLYLRTAEQYARSMLNTCAVLALPLGGAKSFKQLLTSSSGDREVGNAPLGLWVGERLLELSLRERKEKEAREQKIINGMMSKAVSRLAERRISILGS